MPLISIDVECYAGSKAFERPRRILLHGLAHEVLRATAFSVEEDASSRQQHHRYEVLVEDGRRLMLIRQGDRWFLET